MAYTIMLNRRNDFGELQSYEYVKRYTDMKQAISRCRKIMDSYVINNKNKVCIFINNNPNRSFKPISSPSPVLDDSSDFL